MPTGVLPHRGLVQEILYAKRQNGQMIELGGVSSTDVQAVIDALDAMPDFAGPLSRGCSACRESRAYLVALKGEKAAAGL